MAKKRKTKRRAVHHRRRRMSGTAEIQAFAMRLVGVSAGAVGGAFLINAGKTALPSLQASTPWLIPAAVAGAGLALPLVAKGNTLVEDIGMGMIGVGALMAANETFISVPGISGMAFTSNTPGANTLQRSVGCRTTTARVGAGPGNYLNRTVGRHRGMSAGMGALVSN